jgi:hypothetical protein
MKGHHLSFPTKKFKIGSHENNLFFYLLFINFLLKTTPFWKFSNYVNSIDSSLKSHLEKILNLRLTDLQWCQSTLPIRLDLVDWEFAAFPIFASLLSYLQFMVLKSLFLNY